MMQDKEELESTSERKGRRRQRRSEENEEVTEEESNTIEESERKRKRNRNPRSHDGDEHNTLLESNTEAPAAATLSLDMKMLTKGNRRGSRLEEENDRILTTHRNVEVKDDLDSLKHLAIDDFSYKLDSDDIPQDSGVIKKDEQMLYLKVNMSDPYDAPSLIPEALTKERGKQTHYMESFTSGAFKGVDVKYGEGIYDKFLHDEAREKKGEEGNQIDDDPSVQESIIRSYRNKLYNRVCAFLLFAQVYYIYHLQIYLMTSYASHRVYY